MRLALKLLLGLLVGATLAVVAARPARERGGRPEGTVTREQARVVAALGELGEAPREPGRVRATVPSAAA
jgi:hypothetical protein